MINTIRLILSPAGKCVEKVKTAVLLTLKTQELTENFALFHSFSQPA